MATNNTYVCSICKRRFIGYGNDPWPVTRGKNDRCCDICNSTKVISARIHALMHKVEEENNENTEN